LDRLQEFLRRCHKRDVLKATSAQRKEYRKTVRKITPSLIKLPAKEK